MKRTILFALTLILFSIQPAHAAGQEKQTQLLRISPVIVPLTLSPGKTIVYDAQVENLTQSPLLIRMLLSDFDPATEDGGYVFLDTKANPLLSWISLSDTEFILEAKTKKKIQVTINTPSRIPFGGYYGLLFFEPVLPKIQQGTLVSTRIGMLMLANIGVGSQQKPGEILDFSIGSFMKQKGQLPLLLRVKNNSLGFFTAKPRLSISRIFGTTEIQPLEEKFVFPGKVRRWEEKRSLKDATIGIYKASVQVSTGNGQSVHAEKLFLIFPFTSVGISLLVILMLLFLITKRDRLKKTLSILLRGKE